MTTTQLLLPKSNATDFWWRNAFGCCTKNQSKASCLKLLGLASLTWKCLPNTSQKSRGVKQARLTSTI